jgi:hypothetical protein
VTLSVNAKSDPDKKNDKTQNFWQKVHYVTEDAARVPKMDQKVPAV